MTGLRLDMLVVRIGLCRQWIGCFMVSSLSLHLGGLLRKAVVGAVCGHAVFPGRARRYEGVGDFAFTNEGDLRGSHEAIRLEARRKALRDVFTDRHARVEGCLALAQA